MRRALPLTIALAAFALLTVLWIASDRRASQRIYDKYSSANTSEEGLSLASGYLAKQRKVAMLTRPIAREDLERDAVVFRVVGSVPVHFDPENLEGDQFGPPRPDRTPLLADAEEAFVRRGGRMVIAASAGTLEARDAAGKTAKKVFPIWPQVGDVEIEEKAQAFISIGPRMLAIFAIGPQVIVARERIGNGELFLISSPDLFRNDGLARGNHLPLLAALAGANRPVYFDEFAHGMVTDDGSLALMKDWNLGPFLALLVVLAMLIFWRAGKRVGPPEDDYRETRSDAVDLVRSLGALYHEVTSDGDAIALYYDALTRTVASQTGLRGDALHKRVDDLTGGYVPPRMGAPGRMPEAIFKRDLDTINKGFSGVTNAKHQ